MFSKTRSGEIRGKRFVWSVRSSRTPLNPPIFNLNYGFSPFYRISIFSKFLQYFPCFLTLLTRFWARLCRRTQQLHRIHSTTEVATTSLGEDGPRVEAGAEVLRLAYTFEVLSHLKRAYRATKKKLQKNGKSIFSQKLVFSLF